MSSLSSTEENGKHSAFRKGLGHWVLPNRLPRPIDREGQSAKPAGEQPARPIRRARSSATRA